MAKRSQTWGYSPRKPSKTRVSEFDKATILIKAQKLIDEHLKPARIKPLPKGADFNYIVDLFAKWHGRYLIF